MLDSATRRCTLLRVCMFTEGGLSGRVLLGWGLLPRIANSSMLTGDGQLQVRMQRITILTQRSERLACRVLPLIVDQVLGRCVILLGAVSAGC